MHFEQILASCQILSAAKCRWKIASWGGKTARVWFKTTWFFENLDWQSAAKTNAFCFPRSLHTAPAPKSGAPLSLTLFLPFLVCFFFTVPFFSWLFLYSSFLFLTIPLRTLSLLDRSFTFPFFSWLFLCSSCLFLTVPLLILSLLDCSFTGPSLLTASVLFLTWWFLCNSFPYLTVRLVFLSFLYFCFLLFNSPYLASEVSHIDILDQYLLRRAAFDTKNIISTSTSLCSWS